MAKYSEDFHYAYGTKHEGDGNMTAMRLEYMISIYFTIECSHHLCSEQFELFSANYRTAAINDECCVPFAWMSIFFNCLLDLLCN